MIKNIFSINKKRNKQQSKNIKLIKIFNKCEGRIL